MAREIASQYPHLRSRLEGPSTDYGAAAEGSFEFGLRAVFDGLEARLAVGVEVSAASQRPVR
jgi:hypothetical protein